MVGGGLGHGRNNQKKVELSISNNILGAYGAQSIAAGISGRGSRLSKLDLSYNGLAIAGAEAVGSVLKTNWTLKELNLWQNQLTATGNSIKNYSAVSLRTYLNFPASQEPCAPHSSFPNRGC